MAAQMNRHGPHRILVVDDNPDIHEDFRKILCAERHRSSKLQDIEAVLFEETTFLGRQSQFEVDSAFQAQEGLAKVYHALQEGQPYVMAFVDVRMPPGWDGIEVTPMLWKADPNLQIVICTAYSDYTWEEMFAKVGTSDRMFMLKKPFDRMEVLQLAHTLAEKRWQHEETQAKLSRLEKAVAKQKRDLERTGDRLQTEIARLKEGGGSTPRK
jgi:two-component system NtrC family sensor kinase